MTATADTINADKGEGKPRSGGATTDETTKRKESKTMEEHYRVSSTSIEAATARIKEFEQSRHGAGFKKHLREADAGRDTITANDLQYLRDLLEVGEYFTVLTGLYSLGYERGQKAARKEGGNA